MRQKSYLLSLLLFMCFVYVPPQVTYAAAVPSFTVSMANNQMIKSDWGTKKVFKV